MSAMGCPGTDGISPTRPGGFVCWSRAYGLRCVRVESSRVALPPGERGWTNERRGARGEGQRAATPAAGSVVSSLVPRTVRRPGGRRGGGWMGWPGPGANKPMAREHRASGDRIEASMSNGRLDERTTARMTARGRRGPLEHPGRGGSDQTRSDPTKTAEEGFCGPGQDGQRARGGKGRARARAKGRMMDGGRHTGRFPPPPSLQACSHPPGSPPPSSANHRVRWGVPLCPNATRTASSNALHSSAMQRPGSHRHEPIRGALAMYVNPRALARPGGLGGPHGPPGTLDGSPATRPGSPPARASAQSPCDGTWPPGEEGAVSS